MITSSYIMAQKIYSRSVIQLGHESKHLLMITIPKKICEALDIEKGTKLYFKLEDCKFVVSKDTKFLDSTDNINDTIIIGSTKTEKETRTKRSLWTGYHLLTFSTRYQLAKLVEPSSALTSNTKPCLHCTSFANIPDFICFSGDNVTGLHIGFAPKWVNLATV
jgi:bifunctional DNA-binding transcriptional regulator/antitoxin component of YhaV-PrlF toxin-antitoxin module